MENLQDIRHIIREQNLAPDNQVLSALEDQHPMPDPMRREAVSRAVGLVNAIRNDSNPGLMEVFLAEYGLSTNEGVALMCLAEALLRVPDPETVDALIEDKIAPSSWGVHLGKSSSSLVNASTWALMLTGKVLKEGEGDGIATVLHGAVKRLGEPVIRTAVGRAIREMGHQFVLGRTIDEAVRRGAKLARQGYTFSYDMLGEAALTAADARKYFDAYANAIDDLAAQCKSRDIRENPGISVKLSALHPRYEVGQKDRVLRELVTSTRALARKAAKAGMGFNIDAEEADRLDLSLDVIQAVLRDPDLAGWTGFGVVVQAYGKRAGPVIDWLHALAENLDRKIMVRLVKGAYWDTEIKRAQNEGLSGFPVFTHKSATDASYLFCAHKLLSMTDRIYPQFATHNAHTVASILGMADDNTGFEFQRLQGMGESLHALVLDQYATRCRIYAPVGTHRDLLAYLVRRLLENGANSSFVNQIVDEDVPAEKVAADPLDTVRAIGWHLPSAVVLPARIFADRRNSNGWDLHDAEDLEAINTARDPFLHTTWDAGPLINGTLAGQEDLEVRNPAQPDDLVGQVRMASAEDVGTALNHAQNWADATGDFRREVLERAADLYEENFGALFALLCREAGKTALDAVSELREAVDFLRYYAQEGATQDAPDALGIVTCVSPWNFPLAIFTGQISAALAVGNGVIAKPAESTSLTAHLAVRLLHKAGVPGAVLQFVPGHGAVIGDLLTGDKRVGGVCFTGSTQTARRINRSMADNLSPDAPLIAETGGLNAMIVDSTALPEQAIRDIIASAFQSAGQRCSALRMLYVQKDIADDFLRMLFGAMDELVIGNPWSMATDVGPVISEVAARDINAHIDAAAREGRLLKRLDAPDQGTFVAPAVIRVGGISDLKREVFGPVMHVATFDATKIDAVVSEINATGYGLTFGMHSRIDDRVEQVISRLNVGNIYINRNQIGAVVGAQPFGGEGLSGTGPKAGGPHYLPRLRQSITAHNDVPDGKTVTKEKVERALAAVSGKRTACVSSQKMGGPTGESNLLSVYGRGVVLCLGPTAKDAQRQAAIARQNGCFTVTVAPGAEIDGTLPLDLLAHINGFDLVAYWADAKGQRQARQALAAREGRLIALCCGDDLAARCVLERHVCIDTTASGGNASLLAQVSD